MPPPRTIIVDTDLMLANAARIAATQQAQARVKAKGWDADYRKEKVHAAGWVPRDLAKLAGRPLTASERKRHQQALVAMAAAGLVELAPRWLRIDTAGRKYLAALAKQLTTPTEAAHG